MGVLNETNFIQSHPVLCKDASGPQILPRMVETVTHEFGEYFQGN